MIAASAEEETAAGVVSTEVTATMEDAERTTHYFDELGIKVVLPEDIEEDDPDWHYHSEINMTVKVKNELGTLTKGIAGVVLFIPDNSLPDGDYCFELFVNEDESHNCLGSSQIAFNIEEGMYTGIMNFNNESLLRVNGGYQLSIEASYNSSSLKEYDEISFLIKTHNSVSAKNMAVIFSNFFAVDFSSGICLADVEAADIYIVRYNHLIRETSDYKCEIRNSGSELYVDDYPTALYVGEKVTIKPLSEVYDELKLVYKSSDKTVAAISGAVKITAKKAGTVTITVKDSRSGALFYWTLVVQDPYLGLAAERSKILLGSTFDYDVYGNGYVLGKVSWKSSNQSIGTIDDQTGLFTAKKTGTTIITVNDVTKNYSTSFSVEVYDVSNKELAQYITVNSHQDISSDLEKRIVDLLYTVYPKIYEFFNYGVYTPMVLHFEHLGVNGAYTRFAGDNPPEIYIDIDFLNRNQENIDVVTHELIHCAQAYSFSTADGEDRVWLGEGLTDYGRYLFGLNNKAAGWSLDRYCQGQEYNNGYGVTAAFIKYVVDEHNSKFATMLNNAFTDGVYTEELWKTATGYTIDELWEMYKAY